MQFNLNQVTIGAFTILCTALGGGWTLGWSFRGDRIAELERTIETYEKAGEWQLPRVLAAIGNASNTLSNHLSKLQSLEDLKARNAEIEQQLRVKDTEIATVKAHVNQLQSSLDEKETFIKSLFPKDESFTLSERESKALIGFEIAVGVTDVQPDSVKTTVNNVSRELHSGEYVEIAANNLQCKLLLTGFEYGVFSTQLAHFRFICKATHNGEVKRGHPKVAK